MPKNFKTLEIYQLLTWLRNLDKVIDKANNAKLLMIGMTPKHAIKLDHVEKVRSKTYLKENALPEYYLCKYLYQRDVQQECQKNKLISGAKVREGSIELQKTYLIMSFTTWMVALKNIYIGVNYTCFRGCSSTS